MMTTNDDIRITDTLASVEACVSDICTYPAGVQPCIAVDLEGVQLSRRGRVSLVQMKANHSRTIWILDITVLGGSAFTHPNTEGTTIKLILESSVYKKIFYDVRKDADALYNLYGIDMQNVRDVQIIELAVRKSNRQHSRHLNGLAKAITSYLRPGPQWLRVKELGQAMMNPQHGGSWEVFERRPLPSSLVAYAAQDVALLANLEATLACRIGRQVGGQLTWNMRIENASARRVAESKGPFAGDGPDRALSPSI